MMVDPQTDFPRVLEAKERGPRLAGSHNALRRVPEDSLVPRPRARANASFQQRGAVKRQLTLITRDKASAQKERTVS